MQEKRTRRKRPVDERFWEKVDRREPNDCWLWLGAQMRGYGVFWFEGANIRASRMAFNLAVEVMADGLWALHTCDNPSCCNPAHIYPGTHADNMTDMKTRGRAANGDRNGQRLHPERVARGERSGHYTHPERSPRGDRNGARLHPERLTRGEALHLARTIDADVRTMRALYAQGQHTQKQLAEQFGLSQTAVGYIVRRVTWRHVE